MTSGGGGGGGRHDSGHGTQSRAASVALKLKERLQMLSTAGEVSRH